MRRKRSNVLPLEEQDINKQLQSALNSFILYCKSLNRTEKTIKYYIYSMNELARLMKHFDISELGEVTQDHFREYIVYRLDSGIKDKTINQYIRGWRPFFRFITDEGILKTSNPMENIRTVKEDERIIESFSKEQIIKLLDSTNKNTFTGYRDFLLMSLLIDTGIRAGEAVNIKIGDIDFEWGTIKVFGKNRKDRFVPFQDTLCGIIEKYIAIRGRLDHDYFFVSVENEPLKLRTVQDRIADYGKMARIRGVRVSPHTFRHTFAKLYILNGGDTPSLKSILGHTSLEMVERYVNLFSRETSEQHRKFSPLERLYDV